MELTFIGVNYNTSKKASPRPQCLKISEKVSFNILSEASYAYIILSGQQFTKKGQKNGLFCHVFVNLKISKFKWDIWSNFQTL